MKIYREWSKTSVGESFASFVFRQAKIDREHYAGVEADHKRIVASLDDTLAYWKRQTEQARKDGENFRAEIEKLKTGNKDLADAANAYRLERNAARTEVAEAQAAHNTVVFELHHTRKERDEARKDSDYFKKEAKANALSLNEARAERDYFKTCLDGANAVNSAARYSRPTGRLEAIEARVSELEAQSNAKLADEVLDSLRFAR